MLASDSYLPLRGSVIQTLNQKDQHIYDGGLDSAIHVLPGQQTLETNVWCSDDCSEFHSQHVSMGFMNTNVTLSKARCQRSKTFWSCPVCCSETCILITHRKYAARLNIPQMKGRRMRPNYGKTLVKPPTNKGSFDPIIRFAGQNLNRLDNDLLQAFFTRQSETITTVKRGLSFDKLHLPSLFVQATMNPALCMSLVAMAGTYATLHTRHVSGPDEELEAIFRRTLCSLSKQITEEQQSKMNEFTIMAAVNLVMCQGIAFGDLQTMRTHWKGILALIKLAGGVNSLSGPVVTFVMSIDHFFILFTGCKPNFARNLPLVEIEVPPEQRYGSKFIRHEIANLFESMPDLIQACLSSCRCTELIEADSSPKPSHLRSYFSYFNYLRNAFIQQNSLLHHQLQGTGTLAECVNLTLSLYYFTTLRLLPWQSPIRKAAEQLRTALEASGYYEMVQPSHPARNLDHALPLDLLSWMLFVTIAAAQLSAIREIQDWAIDLLLKTLTVRYKCRLLNWPPNWRQEEIINLKEYCWSDTFLSESYTETCKALRARSQLN